METKNKGYINLFILLIILATLGIAGCNKSSSNPSTTTTGGGTPGANEVWMQGIAFVPASKTITSGTTILFTNKDNTAHTVTSGVPNAADGVFDSGNMNTGATFSYTFNTKGVIKYYCRIHGAMMTATMTVQ